MARLRDVDIRRALKAEIACEHSLQGETLVVDEMAVGRGAARVDIAVINGALHGFEIKSEVDRLDRLESQQTAYQTVFDTVTLVTCPRHLSRARQIIPAWWGISTARSTPDGVRIRRVRKPRPNRSVDPEILASLLWRDEALELLECHGLAYGLRAKPRAAMYRALASSLDRDTLAMSVRETLKARESWRPPA